MDTGHERNDLWAACSYGPQAGMVDGNWAGRGVRRGGVGSEVVLKGFGVYPCCMSMSCSAVVYVLLRFVGECIANRPTLNQLSLQQ